MIQFLRDVARSVIKASGPYRPDASRLEFVMTYLVTIVGVLFISFVVWRFTSGKADEGVMRFVYFTFMLFVFPAGVYLRDRRSGE